MKRINVHFYEDSVSRLDNIKEDLEKSRFYWNVTRADLIRYALHKTFGFGFDFVHCPFYALDRAIADLPGETKSDEF